MALGIAGGRPETCARPVGRRVDGERSGVSGSSSPICRAVGCAPIAACSDGDPRWLDGAAQSRARHVRGGRARPALPSPQETEKTSSSTSADRNRPCGRAILRRAYQATDVKTAQRLLLQSDPPVGARVSRCRGERARRARGDADGAQPWSSSPRLRRSLATTNTAEA